MTFKETVLKVAKKVYGENTAYGRDTGMGLTMLAIMWPEFTIRNRRGQTHFMKEMWVMLPINEQATNFDHKIYGMRTRLSLAESRSGYAHSHLPGLHFTQFCTGSDGINEVWGALKMDAGDYHTDGWQTRFEAFLHLLDSFIQYESLEGVPHRRISSIGFRNQSGVNGMRRRNSVQRVKRELDRNLIKFAIDFNSLTVNLVETDELHDALALLSQEHAYRLPNGSYQGLNDDTGRYQEEEEDITDSSIGGCPFILNYGEDNQRELRLIVDPYGKRKEVTNKRKFMHPDIFNYIREIVENAAKESIIGAAKKQYQAGNQAKRTRNNASIRKFDPADFGLSNFETFEGMVGKVVLEAEQEVGPNEAENS